MTVEGERGALPSTAALVAAARQAAHDERVETAATRCLVDWAGCAIAGSASPLADVLLSGAAVLGRGSTCTVVGRAVRTAPAVAALLNGASSHVLDFDDVNVVMIGHPAAVVLPAALAVAEERDANGPEVLRAVTAGYELAERLGVLLNPDHYEQGWHATATVGCAAAALAAGMVCRLDDEALGRAVGLGLTQAAGVRAMFGSHGKGFHAGRAAMAGVLAASLAEAGADVPADVLHGDTGYLAVAGASRRGEPWPQGPAVLRTAFKPHAACGATHCLIDAVAGVVRDEDLAPADIERIEARVHPLALAAAGIREPRSGLEAKFSLWHTAAMAATTYPLLPRSFDDDVFAAPEIVALRGRVDVEVDAALAYDQAMPAEVTVTTSGGGTYRRSVDTPRGRPANPMSDTELDEKFTALAVGVLGADRAAAALRLAREVDGARSVRPLVAGLAP